MDWLNLLNGVFQTLWIAVLKLYDLANQLFVMVSSVAGEGCAFLICGIVFILIPFVLLMKGVALIQMLFESTQVSLTGKVLTAICILIVTFLIIYVL